MLGGKRHLDGIQRSRGRCQQPNHGNSPISGTFDVQRRSSLPVASNRINVGVTFTFRRSAYSLFTWLKVRFTRMMRPFFHVPVNLPTAGAWNVQEKPKSV